MTADYESGNLEIMEPDKCDEWKWFSWENLPVPLMTPMKNLLKTNFNPLN